MMPAQRTRTKGAYITRSLPALRKTVDYREASALCSVPKRQPIGKYQPHAGERFSVSWPPTNGHSEQSFRSIICIESSSSRRRAKGNNINTRSPKKKKKRTNRIYNPFFRSTRREGKTKITIKANNAFLNDYLPPDSAQ